MGERLPPSALGESFLWIQYIPPKCSNIQSSLQGVKTQNITIILPSRLKMMKCAVNYIKCSKAEVLLLNVATWQ
jgi:hypothetical protein